MTTLVLALALQEIIIDERPFPRPGLPTIPLRAYSVDGEVVDQTARIEVRATFFNPHDAFGEGHYLMNLPRGASVSRFTMTVNGQEMAAELLDANQARQIYEEYVRKFIDPGLLEMAGDGLLRARVFPIAAQSEISILVRLEMVLERRGATVELRLPFARYVEGNDPVASVRTNLRFESSTPIGNVYSPSHALTIVRPDERRATVTYESRDYTQRRDLLLFYNTSEDPFGMTFLTYRPDGEEGTFLLLVSPRFDLAPTQVLPRDFVFVLDRSGSMAGAKIQQARESLRYCISNLRDGDRFNIVDFATDVRAFSDRLESVGENRERAIRYIDAIEAAGGTNIEGGLRQAMALFDGAEGRVPMMFFATDGLPTVGERNVTRIADLARSANPRGARLFAFGVGLDVNTALLDRIAEDGNGAREYVQPEEDIEEKVSYLYVKTSSPVLTDLALEFGALEAYDLYPQRIRDLYKGDQLILAGRYRGSAPATIRLTGTAAGEHVHVDLPVEHMGHDGRMDFLPRLWATRKVAFLVDQIRMSTEPPQELVDEVVALARRYAIVTPYTSYLILDDSPGAPEQLGVELEGLRRRASESGFGHDADAGRAAQEESERLREARAEAPAAEAQDRALRDLLVVQGGEDRPVVQFVAGRAFYWRDAAWVDSRFDPEHPGEDVAVEFGSDEYFALLAGDAELARTLSVGAPAVVVHGGRTIRVTLPATPDE